MLNVSNSSLKLSAKNSTTQMEMMLLALTTPTIQMDTAAHLVLTGQELSAQQTLQEICLTVRRKAFRHVTNVKMDHTTQGDSVVRQESIQSMEFVPLTQSLIVINKMESCANPVLRMLALLLLVDVVMIKFSPEALLLVLPNLQLLRGAPQL